MLGFSTLYGSKWVATCSNLNSGASPSTSFSTLYGSKWVATGAALTSTAPRLLFQYPLRVEVGCNMAMAAQGKAHTKVSVPSTGRSGLQPHLFASSSCCVTGFQYPLRVEVGCNQDNQDEGLTGLDVSVPSTGRSGLQPREGWDWLPFHLSFSTLYGSKWVATASCFCSRLADRCFSTLYGSKWVATRWRAVR